MVPPHAPPGEVWWTIERTLATVAGLLVGGIAIAVAAGYLVDDGRYGKALVTAAIGSLVWLVVVTLIAVPLVAVPLALVAWIAVIDWRYDGGWFDAVAIGVGAWAVAVVLLAALGLVGLGGVSAAGIPWA